MVHALIGEDLADVDARLAMDLPSEFSVVPEVAHHLIGAGGKRIRPILVCLTARALRASKNSFLELAAVVEMVHTATLFHDDVIDESKMRRSRPAAHIVYGAPVAILVGDRLYSDAFRRLLDVHPRQLAKDLAKAIKLVLEGEIFQLQRRGTTGLTFDQYLRLVGGKTAALFRFATLGAARSAGASATQVRAASRFGWNLGIAFQMADDIIDFEAESETGKTRLADLEDKKVALPLLVALRRDPKLLESVNEYMAVEKGSEDRLALRSEILRRIEATDAAAASRLLATRYADRAIEAIDELPNSPYADALRRIARYVCDRNS